MDVLTLDDALDRLLHAPVVLRAFVERGPAIFAGLSSADRSALDAIDRTQLVRAAHQVRTRLLHRRHRGSGGIATAYPETIAWWRAAHPGDDALAELAEAFMSSEAFFRYREIPFAGSGLCLEEAFYRFCARADIGEAAGREHEFLLSIARALVVSPTPAFEVPAEFRKCREAWCGVSRGPNPTLYAATPHGLVTGPVTAFLRALVLEEEEPTALAQRHGVGDSVLDASLGRLHELGIR